MIPIFKIYCYLCYGQIYFLLWRMFHKYLKFYSIFGKNVLDVSYIMLLDGYVEVFCVLTDFLSSLSYQLLSGVLKSLTIIVELFISLSVLSSVASYILELLLCVYNFYIFMILTLLSLWSTFVSSNCFCLKDLFCFSRATSGLLWLLFTLFILFHNSAFNLFYIFDSNVCWIFSIWIVFVFVVFKLITFNVCFVYFSWCFFVLLFLIYCPFCVK